MATAQRASGTPTPGRSARVGRKRDGIPWDSSLTQVVKGALYRVFGWLELPAGYRYTTQRITHDSDRTFTWASSDRVGPTAHVDYRCLSQLRWPCPEAPSWPSR